MLKTSLQFRKEHFIKYCVFIEIGDGWRAAILNTSEELDFIREGQRSFSNSLPYWIGGSTNEPNAIINYTEYITNSSGTILRWYKCSSKYQHKIF